MTWLCCRRTANSKVNLNYNHLGDVGVELLCLDRQIEIDRGTTALFKGLFCYHSNQLFIIVLICFVEEQTIKTDLGPVCSDFHMFCGRKNYEKLVKTYIYTHSKDSRVLFAFAPFCVWSSGSEHWWMLAAALNTWPCLPTTSVMKVPPCHWRWLSIAYKPSKKSLKYVERSCFCLLHCRCSHHRCKFGKSAKTYQFGALWQLHSGELEAESSWAGNGLGPTSQLVNPLVIKPGVAQFFTKSKRIGYPWFVMTLGLTTDVWIHAQWLLMVNDCDKCWCCFSWFMMGFTMVVKCCEQRVSIMTNPMVQMIP